MTLLTDTRATDMTLLTDTKP